MAPHCLIFFQGCVVGPCGDMNCPNGAFGVGNDRVTFRSGLDKLNDIFKSLLNVFFLSFFNRGNAGPRNTGSNGNAGPVGADGRPVNPAEIAYLKQLENYKKWELQQQENNKKIIG